MRAAKPGDHGSVIRTSTKGRWHRGGRYDYPGSHHCPIGLGLVLMPRHCHVAWREQVSDDAMCDRCLRGEQP